MPLKTDFVGEDHIIMSEKRLAGDVMYTATTHVPDITDVIKMTALTTMYFKCGFLANKTINQQKNY